MKRAKCWEAGLFIGKFSSDLLTTDDGAYGTTTDNNALNRPSSSRSDYVRSTLGRLYALGYETYNIIPRAESMRGDELQQYSGNNMTVSIANDGSVVRHPVWVTFKSGLVEPVVIQPALQLE